ncbi:hypothetical protein GCM10027445_49110 [Amycolatopsis endophytica]|uniref:Lipoprotein n=1 Tax=Amycolatopsis endophytica TaxID=860233 RepID=A0A853BFX5_9PSEU|nr:hypothetical protein [Amycolatopsis endophytica]NYI93426.1 hypothetical protein [Amycolatopsis endophytica]
MKKTRLVVLPFLASAALALSACGGSDEPSTPTTTDAGPTSISKELPPPSSSAEAAPAGATEKTAPGTELKVGDRAVIAWDHGTVAVTVTAVEAGDKAAMEQQYGERAKGLTPYFVRYTLENVDGADHGFASSPNFGIAMADGGPTGVVITGELGTCTDDGAPEDFTTVGAKYEACDLSAAQDGAAVAGAEYDSDDYSDEPLVWTK